MALGDFIGTYPNRWVMTGREPFSFITRLLDDDLITQDDHDELLREVRGEIAVAEVKPTEEARLKSRFGKTFFDYVSDFFSAMWGRVWATLLGNTDSFLGKIWDSIYNRLGQIADWWAANILPTPEEAEKFPPWVRDRVAKLRTAPSMLGYLEIIIYQIGWVIGANISLIPIIITDARRSLNKKYSPELPDIATLTRYSYYNPDKLKRVYDIASEQGFDQKEVDIFINAAASIIGPQELRDLWLRGEIDDKRLSSEMHMQGFTQERVDKLKQLFFFIPGPSDLVRFSVREAFDPAYIAEFGTLQEFPPEFAEQAKKVGVSQYWAEKYWASHWELPSIQLGFEMLHRGVITRTELDGLFKAADIMPWWREKVLAVSYNPLTRVDVRRMHKIGVLDRDAVKRAYLDVGYNDDNAELMTEFTIRYNTEAERDLTKTDFLGAYQRRLITYGEAQAALLELGYDTNEVALLLSRIDYDLEKKRKSTALKNLEKGYKKGVYTLDHIQSRMSQMNMPGAEITEAISMWDSEKRDDTEPLTKADLSAMFKKRIIDEETYRERLTGLDYTKGDIELLVKLNKAGGGG